ncbi:MAG: hypothetical protein KGJ84_09900 [Elusimicrobia bacterium]|nr:hypothetical protein [Elusimicrobiota bacterium]
MNRKLIRSLPIWALWYRSMKFIATSAVLLGLVLPGCATQSRVYWANPNKNTQQFYQDNSECLSMSNGGNPQYMPQTSPDPFSQGLANGYNQGLAIQSQQKQETIYQQCMMGRGWSLRQQ